MVFANVAYDGVDLKVHPLSLYIFPKIWDECKKLRFPYLVQSFSSLIDVHMQLQLEKKRSPSDFLLCKIH